MKKKVSNKKKTQEPVNPPKSDVNQSAYILALAKKMNMRIPEELLEISLSEFFDMTEIYFDTGTKKEEVRHATQDDIDQMLG